MEYKDELVINMAKLFLGLVSSADLNWEQAYFRYVEYSPSNCSTQWSYKFGREVTIPDLDGELESVYLLPLKQLAGKLYSELGSVHGVRPVVVVLRIDPEKNYNVKFDYNDSNALEINKISLGRKNSYFSEDEVNISQGLREFQKSLGSD
ncbi:MAG: hypothetical protein ABWY06_24855 [Pseudomonas sp.]|uniref:hypothetical protein n=1 Tax=Pseudomonas sp. TaxID=306 RepID=UPI003399D959